MAPPSLGNRLRRRRGSGRGASGGIQAEANPAEPELLEDFRFFAVMKTWMDEDIVEAAVRNAMVQGAEAVYLVDNASSDATVERAEAAGASLAESYRSEVFEGRIAQVLMNAVVARVSLAAGDPYVWWLYLDSDEFPEGPDGSTLVEYLGGLDRRFRVAGSTYYNHLPAGKPEYLPGFHPIDFQPLCTGFEPGKHPPCALGHWKHPLQRFDRDGLFVTSDDGFHCAEVRTHVPLVEPERGVVTHHFQWRDEATTRAKLELVGGGTERIALHESIGHAGFAKRRRSIDAVYAQRWDEVVTPPNRHPDAGADPKPWPNPASSRRWYDAAALEDARARWSAQHGTAASGGD